MTTREPSRPPAPRREGAPAPGEDVPAQIVARLREFTGAMDHYIDVHGGRHGLHRTDLNALAHVMEAGRRGAELTPGELAAVLNLSPPAISALLARLESVGHVRRRHSEADRRRVAITMTDQAMGVGREVFAPIGAAVRGVIDELSPQEQEVVLRFLSQVVEAAHASTDRGGMP